MARGVGPLGRARCGGFSPREGWAPPRETQMYSGQGGPPICRCLPGAHAAKLLTSAARPASQAPAR